MFINCRHCHALVATDPATDLPPERCPRCAGVLRRTDAGTVPDRPRPGAVATTNVDVAAGLQTGSPATAAVPPPPDPAPTPRVEQAAPVAQDLPGADGNIATAPDVDGPDDESAGDVVAASGPAPTPTPAATSAPTPAPVPAPDTEADAAQEPPALPAAASEPGDAATASGPVPEADEPSPGQTDTPPVDAPGPSQATAPAQQDTQASPEAQPAMPPPEDAPATADPADPAFAARPAGIVARTGGRHQRTLVAAVIAALALLLALQIVLADRERLAADARWRPLVAATCSLFGCEVPPWREPSAIVLVSRDVRPHPDGGNALRVRASFRNDARWPQAWPRLLLTLSDVDGRPVAARAFESVEYLGSTPGSPMAPGQHADIELDIHEPSVATVSYAFDFRE